MSQEPENLIRNMINMVVACSLHHLIVVIFITFGLFMWNRKQSLFSWSFRRFFSYFCLLWVMSQINSLSFFHLIDCQESIRIVDFLVAYFHPHICNLETFTKIYKCSPESAFYETRSYMQVLGLIYMNTINPFIHSISLSIGFALWNPKFVFTKFSLRILISIFFLFSVGSTFISKIDSMLYRSSYRALQYYHLKQSKKDNSKSDH